MRHHARAARALLLTLLLGGLAACGGGAPADRSAAGARADEAEPVGVLAPPGPLSLAVGVDERHPALLGGADPPAGFAAGRGLVDRVAPRWVRLQVQWDELQPRADGPPSFAVPEDGCARGAPPCAPYAAPRDQLRAIAAAQRARPDGARLMLVVYGMPAWAGAADAPGCGRGDTDASARPLAVGREAAYADFLRALLAEADRHGARVDAVAPWNEPNVAYFLDPQRTRCDGPLTAAPPASVAPYTRLVRATDAVLDATRPTRVRPRRPALVVGELAAVDAPRRHLTSADEVLRAMAPADLCRADAISLHRYVDLADGVRRVAPAALATDPDALAVAAADDAVGPVDRALGVLDAVPCARRTPVWITETGTGAPSGNAVRDRRPPVLRAECRAMGDVLARWRAGGRVRMALQYSVREDPVFPVGLYDAALAAAVPTAELWATWGGARAAGAPGPGVPPACAEQPGDAAVLATVRTPGDRDATPD